MSRTACHRVALFSAFILIPQLTWAVEEDQKSKPNSQSKLKITVSKQTTYVTGPLTKDGYVDFGAALNARYGKDITAKENANVLFWQAFGPHPNGATMEPEFFNLMGMHSPPKEGDYFLGIGQYLKHTAKIKPDDPNGNKIIRQLRTAAEGSWTAKQMPHIAQWLTINAKPLTQVIEGTKRSKYFSPLIAKDDSGRPGRLFAAMLPGIQQTRSFARALTARAMLRVGEGDIDSAWQDLLTCHRLGRLVGRGPTLIGAEVGIAIDRMARETDLAFLEQTKPSAKQVVGYLRDLSSLSPMPEMAEKIDLSARLELLDIMQMIARDGTDSFPFLFWLEDDGEGGKLLLSSVDWDVAMGVGNKWYDQLVAALRKKDRREMAKTLDRLNKDLMKLANKIRDAESLPDLIKKSKSTREGLGQLIGNFMTAFLLPGAERARISEDRAVQGNRNLQIAFALAAYHNDRSRYPDRLDRLAPKYLKAVPGDLFSGKPLIYHPSKQGYLIYSVGANEKDDSGRGRHDDPPGDDPHVRMPLPTKKK